MRGMIALLEAILAGYAFIHPTDQAEPGPARLTTRAALRQSLLQVPGKPADIREDISPYLARMIRRGCVDGVLGARNFTEKEAVRWAYTAIFDKILEYWTGAEAARLRGALTAKIVEGDCKEKEEGDAELQWLSQDVLDVILQRSEEHGVKQ